MADMKVQITERSMYPLSTSKSEKEMESRRSRLRKISACQTRTLTDKPTTFKLILLSMRTATLPRPLTEFEQITCQWTFNQPTMICRFVLPQTISSFNKMAWISNTDTQPLPRGIRLAKTLSSQIHNSLILMRAIRLLLMPPLSQRELCL
jgi:hypothetical protein